MDRRATSDRRRPGRPAGSPGREPLAEPTINAGSGVHRTAGPGLLESACEQALCHDKATGARRAPLTCFGTAGLADGVKRLCL